MAVGRFAHLPVKLQLRFGSTSDKESRWGRRDAVSSWTADLPWKENFSLLYRFSIPLPFVRSDSGGRACHAPHACARVAHFVVGRLNCDLGSQMRWAGSPLLSRRGGETKSFNRSLSVCRLASSDRESNQINAVHHAAPAGGSASAKQSDRFCLVFGADLLRERESSHNTRFAGRAGQRSTNCNSNDP